MFAFFKKVERAYYAKPALLPLSNEVNMYINFIRRRVIDTHYTIYLSVNMFVCYLFWHRNLLTKVKTQCLKNLYLTKKLCRWEETTLGELFHILLSEVYWITKLRGWHERLTVSRKAYMHFSLGRRIWVWRQIGYFRFIYVMKLLHVGYTSTRESSTILTWWLKLVTSKFNDTVSVLL